jgi:integrase
MVCFLLTYQNILVYSIQVLGIELGKKGGDMPKHQKYFKTNYPGVTFINGKAVGSNKMEKTYYITYRRDGQLIFEKAGRQFVDDMTPSRAAAMRGRRIEGKEPTNKEKRDKERAAKKAEAVRWTIDKIWDLYCENRADNKSLNNEKIKYEKAIRKKIGKKVPSELVPMDIDRLRMNWQKKGKKTMAARVLELLRRTINYGVKRGLITPLTFKIEIPRLNNQTTEDLSPDQIKKLIEVLDADEDQTAANIMRLALFTGMRRSEIFKLKWDNIDFRRGFITLVDPKGGQDQTIPLNEAAGAIFESIDMDDDSPFVFPGRFSGEHLTDCRDSFARIAKAAEFPPGFRPLHGLRHVYASMLASSGKVDLFTLQKLMTHKSPLMTQRYAHLRDEALKKASQVAGDIVAGLVGEKDDDKKVVNLTDNS